MDDALVLKNILYIDILWNCILLKDKDCIQIFIK